MGVAVARRFRSFPFLTACLPILFAGGVGGTLFHGTRAAFAFYLLDIVPIFVLAFFVAGFLWRRRGPRLVYLVPFVGGVIALQVASHYALPDRWAINVSYAALACLVVVPAGLALVRSRFRHAGWVATAAACFGIAWTCRAVDAVRPPVLPTGTHWLWHLFGAAATAALAEYVYRVEGEGKGGQA